MYSGVSVGRHQEVGDDEGVKTVASVCGIISTVLAVYAWCPYIRAILDGRTRPHQLSWLVFMIMNAIVTTAQVLEGGRASVLISGTFTLGSALAFGLSFRYGTRGTSRFDWILFALSLITIVAWVLTRNNAVAIWLTVLIDVFATSMIVLKIRRHPDSDAAWPWLIGGIAFVFSCVSVLGTPSAILYVRPAYGLLSQLAVVAAVQWYGRRLSPPARVDASRSA